MLIIDVTIMQQMLLRHCEEHDLKMNYGLTFDTGWCRLDVQFHKELRYVSRAPTKYLSCEHSAKKLHLQYHKFSSQHLAQHTQIKTSQKFSRKGL